ncbi:MAG: D-cysteine desulfhydrase family protein [Acidobacteriota bacterium]
MISYSINDLKKVLDTFPRKELILLPSPLKKMKGLTNFLEGPEIYMKRDDLTGLAFGGNKSRKLEFIIADILDKKADTVITWASLQSNWCLQTAAAVRIFGIKPILILFDTGDIPFEFDGNLLLDFILEADIRTKEADKGKVVKQDYVDEILNEVKEEVIKQGNSPYIAPIGGSMTGGSMDQPLGAIAYTQAFLEILEQMNEWGEKPDYIVHATGSGGTQAGLVVGAKAVLPETRILGISVSDKKEEFSPEVKTIAKDTVNALGLDMVLKESDILVFDQYIGDGYGIINQPVAEAIRLTAKKEGIFLDPVYTGKAMVGLLDLIRKGYFSSKDKIVFLHTGGTAVLFPYKHQLKDLLTN